MKKYNYYDTDTTSEGMLVIVGKHKKDDDGDELCCFHSSKTTTKEDEMMAELFISALELNEITTDKDGKIYEYERETMYCGGCLKKTEHVNIAADDEEDKWQCTKCGDF